ncbi:unnamed protein product, partial [Timema podura]|nr:unnamed protein product [Timema podura]
ERVNPDRPTGLRIRDLGHPYFIRYFPMNVQQVSNTSVAPGPGVSMNPQGQGPQTSQANQSQQGGILMSQTNTMAMGGGQITQNVVNPGGIGQQGTGATNSQNSQGQQNNDRQQQPSSTGGGGGGSNLNRTQGMMSTGPQRPQFDHIEAARQQNLAKIQQLRQTLEAAQQQELQYKSQLEIYNHMKIQQLQQNLEVAQQQEMQYKAQMEQEQQKMLRAQLQQMTQQQQQQRQMNPQGMQNTQQQQSNQQQQRMMRPQLANNPGLRHLLQQVSPYLRMTITLSYYIYIISLHHTSTANESLFCTGRSTFHVLVAIRDEFTLYSAPMRTLLSFYWPARRTLFLQFSCANGKLPCLPLDKDRQQWLVIPGADGQRVYQTLVRHIFKRANKLSYVTKEQYCIIFSHSPQRLALPGPSRQPFSYLYPHNPRIQCLNNKRHPERGHRRDINQLPLNLTD